MEELLQEYFEDWDTVELVFLTYKVTYGYDFDHEIVQRFFKDHQLTKVSDKISYDEARPDRMWNRATRSERLTWEEIKMSILSISFKRLADERYNNKSD